MTNFKRLLALLMAVAMCFALCACKDNSADPVESDAAQTDNAGSDADSSDATTIVADLTQEMFEFASGLKNGDTAITVNGQTIPNELFFYWLSYDCYYMDYYYYQMGSYIDFSDESLQAYVLEDVESALIYYAVLRGLCQEAGVTVSDAQLTEFEAMISSTIESSYGGDADLFYQSYGLSEESLAYLYHNDYLYANYLETMDQPTQDELDQYVTDNGIFGVKHILLQTVTQQEDGSLALLDGTAPTNDDGSEYTGTANEYNEAQLALAQSILDQLNASDDPLALFDELMLAHTEDPGVTAYPDGYTFTADDSLVDGFREATLALAENEISRIVSTDYGYHIMLRLPVDASSFVDTILSEKMDALLAEGAESAEVELADDIASLDVATFYDRYMAYGSALYEKITALNSATTN